MTQQIEIQAQSDKRHMRRVILSGYLGSAVEFYDFLVYGTAASLVFAQVFFSDLSPLVGTIAAFGTLATGYIARPLGGVIFGHFGDRIGRKQMLVLTMLLMGTASTLIGLVPTPDVIGVWAPILLVLLRVIQGIALGGEWGGATLMALEHSRGKRRGFAAALVGAGGPTGAVLAALIMGLFALLPQDQFLDWGWRVPFLLSAVLVAIALWIRLGVHESPLFQEAAQDAPPHKKEGTPLLQVLRAPKVLILAIMSGIGGLSFQALMATFALTYAVLGGATRSEALFAAAVASAINIVGLPLFGMLSDKVGRRPVLMGAAIAAIVLVYPVLHLIGSGNIVLMYLGYILGYSVLVSAFAGPMPAFMTEQFKTKSRYTGGSLGYQMAATAAGITPLIAAQLLLAGGGQNMVYVAIFSGGLCVLTLIALAFIGETHRKDLSS